MPLTLAIIMQCGLMKKVNCAEEIEPQSLPTPGEDGSQQTQFLLFVSLLSMQRDMHSCNCIVSS